MPTTTKTRIKTGNIVGLALVGAFTVAAGIVAYGQWQIAQVYDWSCVDNNDGTITVTKNGQVETYPKSACHNNRLGTRQCGTNRVITSVETCSAGTTCEVSESVAACVSNYSTTDASQVPVAPVIPDEKVPLTDLLTNLYLGQFQGGLYPGGSNYAPLSHHLEGVRRAAAIQPIDGKIVMISVGLSNTNQEFCSFAQATANENCNPWSFVGQQAANQFVNHETFVPVNCARGGQEASVWVDAYAKNTDDNHNNNYDICDQRLADLGLQTNQVQIAWVKLSNAFTGPDDPARISLPAVDADAYRLETRLAQITNALKIRYPNLQQVFFSTRIYGGFGNAAFSISPEPYAYEHGFSVKWLVEAQIRQMENGGTPDLSDPNQSRIYNTPVLSNGPVADSHVSLNYADGSAPWVAWGPYLWANGDPTPLSSAERLVGLPWDPPGIRWSRSDIEADALHPSDSGEEKVATQLMHFFLGSPYSAPYFSANGTQVTIDGEPL